MSWIQIVAGAVGVWALLAVARERIPVQQLLAEGLHVVTHLVLFLARDHRWAVWAHDRTAEWAYPGDAEGRDAVAPEALHALLADALQVEREQLALLIESFSAHLSDDPERTQLTAEVTRRVEALLAEAVDAIRARGKRAASVSEDNARIDGHLIRHGS